MTWRLGDGLKNSVETQRIRLWPPKNVPLA
jgi:hypothetical protein